MVSYQIIDIALDDSREVRADNGLVEVFQAGLSSHFLRVQEHSFPDVSCLSKKESPALICSLICYKELHKRMCEMTLRAFAWPPEVKNAMSMANSNHFSGFTGCGDEVTNEQVDNREVSIITLQTNSPNMKTGRPSIS